MQKPTFRTQFRLCLLASLACMVLARLSRIDWFHNLNFLLWGGLFLWNPVWPESLVTPWPEKLRLGLRIGAILLLYIGLTGRFGS